jgi:serine/threonine-protein kinase
VINRRYRIVALVGQGGMGEVYRADDLALGQPVALKFLPDHLARDPDRLARFRNEVKLARQVSHPHVCRVHDIGEADGRPFLTMEYIDGEDLGSLLRRIGRLPPDKAVELSRQVCAGLGVAHSQGVLHRDLKPANVMIDGGGQARITDFGLAALAGHVRGDEARAGTPAYMAPEQRAGREVTVRSDLYSLGLVLYKMFTGRHPGRPDEGGIAPPSQVVAGLDPRLDQVILTCLEEDPGRRPPSALAVAAGLPGGGDLLAAAMAAGQTPAPEVLANAGTGRDALHPAVAVALLLAALLGGLAYLLFLEPLAIHRQVPLDAASPEMMTHRARQVAERLGYPDPPADSSYKYFFDQSYLRYLEEHNTPAPHRAALPTGRPAVIYFWYGQGRAPLVGLEWGVVHPTDPAPVKPGMLHLSLDLKGRLIDFLAVPDRELPGGAAPEPDWQQLFDEADLGPLSSFRETAPRRTPPVYADRTRAWDGVCPGLPDVAVHVEAASRHGRPVFFQMRYPAWGERTEEPLYPASSTGLPSVAASVAAVIILSALFACGILLARRNLRLGRGDLRGAVVVSAALFVLEMLNWFAIADHTTAPWEEFGMLTKATAWGLLWAGVVGLYYLAAEPYVRRRWPQWLVSFSRLLGGRWRDARVGRDVLIGCCLAIVSTLLLAGCRRLTEGPDPTPGMRAAAHAYNTAGAPLFFYLSTALAFTFGFTLVLLLLVFVCRKTWLAFLVFYLLGVGLPLLFTEAWKTSPAQQFAPTQLIGLLIFLVTLVVLWRFGAVALIVYLYVGDLMGVMPITLHLSAWYAPSGLATAAAIAGLLAYGFVISLGGRPLFRPGFFGEPEPPAAGR